MGDDLPMTPDGTGERLDPLPALTEEAYLAEVLRSAPRLDLLTQPCEALLLGALSLCGAAGEVAALVKQHCYHAHPLDRVRLTDELGEVLWSLTWLCHTLDTGLGAIMLGNMTRLQAARRPFRSPPEEKGLLVPSPARQDTQSVPADH